MAASISGPIDRSTLAFFTVTGLASVSKIVSAAITTSISTSVLVSTSTHGLGIAAAVVDIFAVLLLITCLGLFLKRSSGRIILFAWIPGTVSCLFDAFLSIATLAGTIQTANAHGNSSSNAMLARGSAAAGIAVTVIGLIPQTVFYVWTWPRSKQAEPTALEAMQQQPSPSRSANRHSISLHLGSIGPTSPPKFFGSKPEPTSPSRSIFSSSQTSLRESVSQLVRPMSSKTRLMTGSPFSSTKDVRSGSPAGHSSNDAMRSSNDDFGEWDTSGIEDRYDSPFGSRTKVQKLETIPGSRPVSPAGALDGPFPNDDSPEEDELPLPDSAIQRPKSPASETGSMRSIRSFRPPIRVNTATAKEAHIHPLFRTESPAPPPMTSPNTVITASPFAGQVVSPERAMSPMSPWLNGSRPASPQVPASPARSRTGSVKSTRTVPASPVTMSSPIEPPQRSFSSLSKARALRPND